MGHTCDPSSQDPVVVMKFEFCAHSARLLRKLNHVLLWILLNNKLFGLSPSVGHHSLLFDQGFQKISGWEGHLTVIGTQSNVTLY